MSRVRVHNFSVSLDGFATGEGPTFEAPFGHAGNRLHEWFFETRSFRRMQGSDGGDTGVDDAMAGTWDGEIGAEIMGRGKFWPQTGPWPDEEWKGWWGPNPPYHVPTFVLTHHARPPVAMEGGTTFQFVTDGIHAALRRASEAAGGKDVRLGGGVATIRQYLTAGLVDEMHLAVSPVLLGRGENLLGGIDAVSLGYECSEHVPTRQATHVVLTRRR